MPSSRNQRRQRRRRLYGAHMSTTIAMTTTEPRNHTHSYIHSYPLSLLSYQYHHVILFIDPLSPRRRSSSS